MEEIKLIQDVMTQNRAIYKLLKAHTDMLANMSLNYSKEVESLREEVKELQKAIQENNKLIKEMTPVEYSASELFTLKKSMTWQQLSIKTGGIPISTLQYRVRQYKSKNRDLL